MGIWLILHKILFPFGILTSKSFKEGDLVTIDELGFEGTISSINGNKVTIDSGNSLIKTTIDKLTHIEKATFKPLKPLRNVDEMISRIATIKNEISVIAFILKGFSLFNTKTMLLISNN